MNFKSSISAALAGCLLAQSAFASGQVQSPQLPDREAIMNGLEKAQGFGKELADQTLAGGYKLSMAAYKKNLEMLRWELDAARVVSVKINDAELTERAQGYGVIAIGLTTSGLYTLSYLRWGLGSAKSWSRMNFLMGQAREMPRFHLIVPTSTLSEVRIMKLFGPLKPLVLTVNSAVNGVFAVVSTLGEPIVKNWYLGVGAALAAVPLYHSYKVHKAIIMTTPDEYSKLIGAIDAEIAAMNKLEKSAK
jgi:hypothetical protein